MTCNRSIFNKWYNVSTNNYMELQPDRIETTIRLLSNGRYIWTITLNTTENTPGPTISEKLKQLDGSLADAFPNHVKTSSFKVGDFQDE